MATSKKIPRRSAEAGLDRQQAAQSPRKRVRKPKAVPDASQGDGTPQDGKEREGKASTSVQVPSESCGHHLHPCVLAGGKTCCEERRASKKRGEIRRFLETHGPQWFDILRNDPIRLRSIGFTEEDVSPHTIRQIVGELIQEKAGIEATWAANNKDPTRKHNIVVPGHVELDPDKNAEHPVKGEAYLEKVLKDKKKAETMERISNLRARKTSAFDYNDPTPETTFSTEEIEMSATMIVKEPAARKLLAAVGIASDDAPLKKVQARVEGLADMAKEPDFKQPEDAAIKKLLKSVLQMLEKGRPVLVGPAAAKVGSNGHAGKNGKAPAAKKTTVVKKDEGPIETDKFGSRIDSAAAKVNAVLGKKPKKMKEIMEAAGVEDTFYNHLNGLIKKKLVSKSAEGYALK